MKIIQKKENIMLQCHVKAKNPLFLNNPPFKAYPTSLEKTFYPHPYWQIRGSQSPNFVKSGR